MNLVTGATGHIGNVLVKELVRKGESVRVLVLPGEDLSPIEGLDIEVVYGSVPAERFAITADRVSAAIWHLVQHPRRVLYVPFYMALSPLLELLFSTIIDQLGPLLLKNRKTTPL